MSTLVLPGQPLHNSSENLAPSASFGPGKGTFQRNGAIYSSAVGKLIRDGGTISVQGKEDKSTVPETGSIVRISGWL